MSSAVWERPKHLEYFPTAVCTDDVSQEETDVQNDLWAPPPTFIYIYLYKNLFILLKFTYLWTLFEPKLILLTKFYWDLNIFLLFNLIFKQTGRAHVDDITLTPHPHTLYKLF